MYLKPISIKINQINKIFTIKEAFHYISKKHNNHTKKYPMRNMNFVFVNSICVVVLTYMLTWTTYLLLCGCTKRVSELKKFCFKKKWNHNISILLVTVFNVMSIIIRVLSAVYIYWSNSILPFIFFPFTTDRWWCTFSPLHIQTVITMTWQFSMIYFISTITQYNKTKIFWNTT